jgi:hyperosmotically inducible periplasmic protein
MKNFKMIFGATAALALIAMTGCMSTPDRTAGRAMDDRMTSSKIKSALDSSPVYKFTDVRVNTYKGVVQLSGFVDTDDQKQKATELARTVPTAREIVNNITLKPKEDYSATGRSPGERQTTTGAGTDRTVPVRPSETTPNP